MCVDNVKIHRGFSPADIYWMERKSKIVQQQKKKNRFRRWKAFGTAFTLTLCLLTLGLGFLIADYNTRKVAFGEDSVRTEFRRLDNGKLSVTALGEETVLELPEEAQKWSGRLWTMLPARWRATAWITEAERALAPELLELLEAMGDG